MFFILGIQPAVTGQFFIGFTFARIFRILIALNVGRTKKIMIMGIFNAANEFYNSISISRFHFCVFFRVGYLKKKKNAFPLNLVSYFNFHLSWLPGHISGAQSILFLCIVWTQYYPSTSIGPFLLQILPDYLVKQNRLQDINVV